MSNSETDTVDVTVLEEVGKCFKLRDVHGNEGLFPKSQVSFKQRNVKTGEAVAEIPEWLLKDRGWT